MAASPRAFGTNHSHTELLGGIENGLREILGSLEDDPSLQRMPAAGPRLLAVVSNLVASLEYLYKIIVQERQVTGADPVPIGPGLCSQLLRLAALAVRWPPRDAWLQCEQRSPEATTSTPGQASKRSAPTSSHNATVRKPLCAALSVLGERCLGLLSALLITGTLDPACTLACKLLRMHTLEACSRSLARAVDRLVALCPVDDTVGTRGNAPAAREAAATRTASNRVQGPYIDLVFAVECATAVLHGCAMLVTRLRQAKHDSVGHGAAAGVGGDRPRAPGASAGGLGASSSATGGSGSSRTGSGYGSSSCSAGGGDGGAALGPARRHSYRDALSAGLPGALRTICARSGVVEHFARGVLHLLRARHQQGIELGAVVHAPVGFLAAYLQLSRYLGPSPCAAGECNRILGSPCASYLATAAGLHVLCAADAGPTYGMRPLLAGAGGSLWEAAAGAWPSGHAQPGGLDRTINLMSLSALAYGVLHRPLKSRAALAVLYRLVSFAVASAQLCATEYGASGPGGSGSGRCGNGGDGRDGGGRGGGRGRSSSSSGSGSSDARESPARSGPLLSGPQSASLASLALMNCIERVSLLPPGRRRAAEAERWRLTVAAVRHTVQWAEDAEVQLLKAALCVDLGQMPAGGTLPPQPPPALAPALSAGLLPCLERLVRRAGEGAAAWRGAATDALTAEQQLLVKLFDGSITQTYLAWLLSYGSPTEASALVVSIGKLLRAPAAESLPLTLHNRDRFLLTMVNAAAATLVTLSRCVLSRLLRESGADGTAAAGTAAAGTAAQGLPDEGELGRYSQLWRMAALAACEWVPVLSGLTIGTTGRLIYVTSDMQFAAVQLDAWAAAVLKNALNACVLWLPTQLEAAGVAGPGGSSASSAGAPGTEGQGQGRAAGVLDGRRLRALAREGRVVELVGAGMRLETYFASLAAQGGGSGYGTDDPLTTEQRVLRVLTAAFLLAVSSPDTVRRALARRAWPSRGFPEHCMWNSGVVRQLLGALPHAPARHHAARPTPGVMLAHTLDAWEGGRDSLRLELDDSRVPRTAAAKAHALYALSEVQDEEDLQEQLAPGEQQQQHEQQ